MNAGRKHLHLRGRVPPPGTAALTTGHRRVAGLAEAGLAVAKTMAGRPGSATPATMPVRAGWGRALHSSPSEGGFALLIVVTLLGFIVVLLLGLATYTRIETTIAGNTQRQAQARENALLALNVALGQLQKHAGPDRRVTATTTAPKASCATRPETCVGAHSRRAKAAHPAGASRGSRAMGSRASACRPASSPRGRRARPPRNARRSASCVAAPATA